MNKDIEIMLELQRFWDGVMRGNNEIEKCEKTLIEHEKQKKDMSRMIANNKELVKNLKINLNEQEIKLAELEEHYARLEKQKFIIQKERELDSIQKEIDNIGEEKDKLEEEIILKMDTLSANEKKVIELENSLIEINNKFEKEKTQINERVERFKHSVSEYKENFSSEILKLQPQLRAKFEKLTKSSDGKSIVKVENSICTNCHFSLPSYLNSRLNKNEVLTCLNCGKFIYI